MCHVCHIAGKLWRGTVHAPKPRNKSGIVDIARDVRAWPLARRTFPGDRPGW